MRYRKGQWIALTLADEDFATYFTTSSKEASEEFKANLTNDDCDLPWHKKTFCAKKENEPDQQIGYWNTLNEKGWLFHNHVSEYEEEMWTIQDLKTHILVYEASAMTFNPDKKNSR